MPLSRVLQASNYSRVPVSDNAPTKRFAGTFLSLLETYVLDPVAGMNDPPLDSARTRRIEE